MAQNTNYENIKQSAHVLANAASLVAAVVRGVAGTDVATSLGENKATAELVGGLATQRIMSHLKLTA